MWRAQPGTEGAAAHAAPRARPAQHRPAKATTRDRPAGFGALAGWLGGVGQNRGPLRRGRIAVKMRSRISPQRGVPMLIYAVSFLGGALTIASPCILPVLPFVFARADQSFARSTLPMLAGMGVTFTGVAALASVSGTWVANANEYGRSVALGVLALFGAALLSPALASRLMAPFVAAGNRLSGAAAGRRSSVGGAFLLGVSTGLLWTPCAGPILGLALTGAAIGGVSGHTLALLGSYTAGALSSLALALLAGGRVFAAMKRSLGAEEWVRRGLGVAVLAGVLAIFFGLDRGVLVRLSEASTGELEQALLARVDSGAPGAGGAALTTADIAAAMAPRQEEQRLPDFAGAVGWINSEPLQSEDLAGKVVLLDFWTYSCINCLRTLPYVRAWHEKYKDRGLVVIGVHTPEFAFEKLPDNVRKAVKDLQITYPVAMDNAYSLWYDLKNQAWPAHYFADAQGRIRRRHLGEGGYDESERMIQQLLSERDGSALPADLVEVKAAGSAAAADLENLGSPETYLGFQRAQNFASGELVQNQAHDYAPPAALELNRWGLGGSWIVGPERAQLAAAPGRIVYRFRARDVHLVLGPSAAGGSVRFRVRLDGAQPGEHAGVDVNAAGEGAVTENRLYQLVRQSGTVQERSFEIEFLDPGVEAFAFTFG
jgi:cytochrome c biogenesis protein CcdA/thiol-disulfide isomerase/thioredoxin